MNHTWLECLDCRLNDGRSLQNDIKKVTTWSGKRFYFNLLLLHTLIHAIVSFLYFSTFPKFFVVMYADAGSSVAILDRQTIWQLKWGPKQLKLNKKLCLCATMNYQCLARTSQMLVFRHIKVKCKCLAYYCYSQQSAASVPKIYSHVYIFYYTEIFSIEN